MSQKEERSLSERVLATSVLFSPEVSSLNLSLHLGVDSFDERLEHHYRHFHCRPVSALLLQR